MLRHNDDCDLLRGFRIIALFGQMTGSIFLKFCAVFTELEISQDIRSIFSNQGSGHKVDIFLPRKFHIISATIIAIHYQGHHVL